jgi:hypothetical protein
MTDINRLNEWKFTVTRDDGGDWPDACTFEGYRDDKKFRPVWLEVRIAGPDDSRTWYWSRLTLTITGPLLKMNGIPGLREARVYENYTRTNPQFDWAWSIVRDMRAKLNLGEDVTGVPL